MDKVSFRHLRIALDLTVTETAAVLGVAAATVTAWQSGRYRIPSWVEERLKEMRASQSASPAERDVREAIEERYEYLDSKLYLGEIPDGWLGLVESFLQEVDEMIPETLKKSESFSLDMKEKWGSLRLSPFLDCGEDLEAGQKFWDWIDSRIEEIEEESKAICARCGSKEDVDMTRSGWRLPLCRRHRLMHDGEL